MSESERKVVREIYSEVLFELAEEAEKIDVVLDDIESVGSVLRENRDFAALLESPKVAGAEKAEVVRRVFGGKIDDLTLDFISVLAKRNRISTLLDISMRYESMLDKHYHRHLVEVVLAEKPDEKAMEQLQTDIEKAINGQAKIEVEVDPSIVGGIIIKKDGKVIDNSVASLIERSVSTIVERSRDKQEF